MGWFYHTSKQQGAKVYHDRYTVIEAPASMPVSVSEARAQALIDHSFDDDWIASAIDAATAIVEKQLNRALITRTSRASYEEWPPPNGSLVIPYPPTQQINSIKYIDSDEDEQTLSSEAYLFSITEPAGVFARAPHTWPATLDIGLPISVEFDAGYGGPEDVPSPIRQAIVMLVSQWYDLRTPVVTGTIVAAVPNTVQYLLAPYRNIRI